ncbi:MAG TPA: class I SAM-dependent methyltransferase [Iamia sp.]|nr:class I SAM-dependent methyltransferase [Iamia sp.]
MAVWLSPHKVLGALPPPLERAARIAQHPGRAWERSRLLRQLRSDPDQLPTPDVVSRLRAAWGGAAVAEVDYLLEVCRRATEASTPILECGSGLTTLLAGIYSDAEVHALEESDRWARRMRAALRWYGIDGVYVHFAPLRSYGELSWYTVPPEVASRRYSLVVCDGPISHRSTTPVRFGLWPVLRDRLDDAATILLDDAARATEREVLRRWEALGASVTEAPSASRDYAIVTLA